MANAINLIDGLDGLASGIALAGLLSVAVVGYLGGDSWRDFTIDIANRLLTRIFSF